MGYPVLLLADDNVGLLTTLVEELSTKFEVAGALLNGKSVLDKIATIRPDIAILDISLGDMTGFEVAQSLKNRGCPAKIIFLTLYEDPEFVNVAFDRGASGYVFKSRVTQDLVTAVGVVSSGGRFTPGRRHPDCVSITKKMNCDESSDQENSTRCSSTPIEEKG